MSEVYANAAQTTLAADLTAGAATLTVSSATGFPASGDFRVLIDDELLKVTGVSGTTFTVARAAEAVAGVTAAAAHQAGALVTCVLTAGALAALGGGGGGSGTVTSVSVVTANGVSGTVATATTTPAVTLTLGAITPASVNGNAITAGTGTLTLSTHTLAAAGDATVSGTNTGDQDLSAYLTAAAAAAAYQPLDADLTALAALSGTDTIYYRSGANTWGAVTVGSNLTFSGGTLSASGGGSGTVTAVSVATANGFAGTSSGGATPALTLTTTASGILQGNGTAISAATISANLGFSAGTLGSALGTAATHAAGDFVTVTTTVNGHALSANVTVTASDVGLGSVTDDVQTKAAIVPNTAPAAGQILVGNTGGTAYAPQSVASPFALSSAGALTVVADVPFAGHKATGLADPTGAQDAATKNYVDLAVGNLVDKADCQAATTTTLAAYTYNHVGGSSGVGDTITLTVAAVLVLDGYTPALNDRILVKNETTTNRPYNGIYKLTTVGVALGAQAVLTRTLDFDQSEDGLDGAHVFVQNGTANANTEWYCSVNAAITFGTTNISFSQFTGTTYTADETTLHLAGTTFSIKSTYAGQSSIVTVGTLTGGATGAGFTIALGSSTVTGTLAKANGGTAEDNSTGGTANTFWARPDNATGAAAYRLQLPRDLPHVVTALSDAATVTVDWSVGKDFDVAALTASRAIAFSNDFNGGAVLLRFASGGTGAFTPTWPATVRWQGGVAPTLSNASGAYDLVSIVRWGSGDYLGSFAPSYS